MYFQGDFLSRLEQIARASQLASVSRAARGYLREVSEQELNDAKKAMAEDVRTEYIRPRPTMPKRQYLRHEFACETTITDEDMIRLQIDWALKNGDKQKFIDLTSMLKKIVAKNDGG